MDPDLRATLESFAESLREIELLLSESHFTTARIAHAFSDEVPDVVIQHLKTEIGISVVQVRDTIGIQVAK